MCVLIPTSMDRVGSRTWKILLALAFVINLFTVYCFKSTINKSRNFINHTVGDNQRLVNTRQELEKELLSIIGLHQRPHIDKVKAVEKSAADFMIELYKNINYDDEDERRGGEPSGGNSAFNNTSIPDIHEFNGASLIMSFGNHAHKLHSFPHERKRTLYFNFTAVLPGLIVTNAEVKFYKERLAEQQNTSYLIEIFRISRGTDTKDKSLQPEANLTVSKSYEGWLSMKVTDAANYWTLNRKENLGMYLRVIDAETGHDIDPGKGGIVGEDGPESKRMFMIGFFKKPNEQHVWRTPSERRRRNISPTEEDIPDDYYKRDVAEFNVSRRTYGLQKARRPACRRHELFVDFTVLKWNSWIIAPSGYQAYYCAGECSFPLADHMNASVHAMIQTIAHDTNPAEIPKTCCVPTKLSSLSMLYINNVSSVVQEDIKNMIVEGCGCR